jgi:asparagine synthase (glutamine-hydrolysing)
LQTAHSSSALKLKPFSNTPALTRTLNTQALYDYLTFYATPPNETMFKGIYKLEAGHYAVINRNGEMKKTAMVGFESPHGTFPKRKIFVRSLLC